MLIINADDLGRSTEATDKAIACFAAGRISSATAMVFMADSRRAAEEARKAGLHVGLHMNLSEAFSEQFLPSELQQAHELVRECLTSSKYALVFFYPRLIKQFDYLVKAQIAEFERLYGHAPTHIDGHQHMHLATNILLQQLIPPGVKVRRSFSFRPGQRNLANRVYRTAVDALLERRHPVTDYFFSLSHYLTAMQLDALVRLAHEANVELMAHPERHGEFDFLMSDDYLSSISTVSIGGYDKLET